MKYNKALYLIGGDTSLNLLHKYCILENQMHYWSSHGYVVLLVLHNFEFKMPH